LKIIYISKGKGKGKLHSRTGHKGPEGEKRYNYTLSLTLALVGGGWSTPRPGRFTPGERPGTHFIEGWVDSMAGLDRCGKSRTSGIRSPDRAARSELLYQLRYPGSLKFIYILLETFFLNLKKTYL
jgi:hypothetical protein